MSIPKRNFIKNNSNINTNTSLSKRKSVFQSINTDKIGDGKYFTEGKFGHKKNLGLKGQLSKIKRMGRHGVTKNLSQKNLNSIYTLISERLKKHNRAYKTHITRKDKISIMQNAEKLVHTAGSNFSREDKKRSRKNS